jgi:hypothetical protein
MVQGLDLARYCFYQSWVGMSQGAGGNPSNKVEIFAPLSIPKGDILSSF